MSDPRDHKDKQLSRLYREGAWPEASSQIDRALRRSERARQSVARRWGPPLVLAAMVAIGSSTALMYREQPQAVPAPSPDKAATARSKQPAPAAETRLETKELEKKPAPAREPAPKPVATPRGFTSSMDAAEVERLDRLERALAEKSPATQQPREKQPQSTPAPVHASAAPQAAVSPKPADKPAFPLRAEPVQLPPAPQQGAQAAPVPPALPAPAVPAPGTAAISPGATASDTSGAFQRSPQTWTEDIRKLMAEGRYEEAGGEIARLKNRYPDYALPEDLR